MAEIQREALNVELCAPESDAVHLEASEVVVPGADGVFTVLPEHTPLLSTLGIGVLEVRDTAGKQHTFAVNGGFAEVVRNEVLVLTETVEGEGDIDPARADEARARAEKRLNQRDADLDLTRAEAALDRALARLQAQRRIGY